MHQHMRYNYVSFVFISTELQRYKKSTSVLRCITPLTLVVYHSTSLHPSDSPPHNFYAPQPQIYVTNYVRRLVGESTGQTYNRHTKDELGDRARTHVKLDTERNSFTFIDETIRMRLPNNAVRSLANGEPMNRPASSFFGARKLLGTTFDYLILWVRVNGKGWVFW